MSSDRYDYLLMRVNKVDCATDPRFTEILKTDEYIFHKINRKMNLPYTLPGYEIDSKYEWGKYECHNRFILKIIYNVENEMQR